MSQGLQQIVEQQLRRWRIAAAENNHRRYQDLGQPHVVTLASEHGAGASEVAQRIGGLLGVPVFDREVVTEIARSEHARAETIETLDERARSRVDQHLAGLLRKSEFNQQDHLRARCQVVLALWQHGPCVLLGHGATRLVPRSHAVAVRLLAPEEKRLARVASSQEISMDEARRRTRAADAASARFYGRFFDADLDDLRRFDMALDTSSFHLGGCAQIVVQGFRYKFDGRWRTLEDPAPDDAAA
jgi:cytidylate kinase